MAFPLLLMVDTRLAWVAIGTAIVMIVRKQFQAARPVARRGVDHDVSI